MASQRKNKPYMITREKFKTIKKFDHRQMDEFLSSVYEIGRKDGFEEGKASVPGIDIKSVYETIAGTKGIGPKKLEEIKSSVEARFKQVGK